MSIFGEVSLRGGHKDVPSLRRWIVFISSLQVMEGDNKLVNLIEDWDVLEEYAGEKLGFYQLLSNDGIIEIRVQTGRIDYKKEFTASIFNIVVQGVGFEPKRLNRQFRSRIKG
ncbi:MAG: hypothetical protein WC046_02025 [Candidatus Bathyarchaeia archaeon]|jgi:serine phosphatase RsbU (regulator of sigma subunit)